MSEAWIDVIGIDDSGSQLQNLEIAKRIKDAAMVFGGDRHLQMARHLNANQAVWRIPLKNTFEAIQAFEGQNIVVLATGDPLNFGIGTTLIREFGADVVSVMPSLSAFALATARLGWAQNTAEYCTLHGRPLELIRRHIYPGAKIVILSENGKTPQKLCNALQDWGVVGAKITAFSHMGGPIEQRQDWELGDVIPIIPDFHTLAVHIPKTSPGDWIGRAGALPDHLFFHDGKMTKAHARASAIGFLKPYQGSVFWDIGSGSGSVSVEYALQAQYAKIFAIDHNKDRNDMAAQNYQAFGILNVTQIAQRAEDAISHLPSPDAVFIGGGLSNSALVGSIIDKLSAGGVVVAHAVTLQSEAILLHYFDQLGGQLNKIQLHHAASVGPFHGWKPAMPITQWVWAKR